MNLFKDLLQVFYPEMCVCCYTLLAENEKLICTFCRHDLPLTHFTSYTNNKVKNIFDGRVNVEKGYALLLFQKNNNTQKLIHELKYKGNENIGLFLGNWLGEILKENKAFSDVDIIVPVPLHPKRLKERGYNQVTKFGKRLCFYLNKPFTEDVLIRASASKTQTFKARFERFNNTETKFQVNKEININNKHILLIDDVITTGATLEACILELQKAKNIKVSVLTMAYTA